MEAREESRTENPEEGGARRRPAIGSRITEEMLDDLRSRFGKRQPVHRQWNTGASYDTIRHFAEGIGDMNPLWLDRQYAESSPWRRIWAPPTYVAGMGYVGTSGLRGIHAVGSGVAYTFHRPIYEGDEIAADMAIVDLVKHEGRLADVMYRQIEHLRFVNQDGVLVAEAEWSAMRFERDHAREKLDEKRGRYAGRPLARYTPDGIKGIDEEYAREERRGAVPLYWEDVAVGDYIPHVVKGPLRLTDIICFLMGAGGPYIRAHAFDRVFRAEHPAAYVTNAQGIPDNVESVHWEKDLAEGIATPGVYDYGTERPSWYAHALGNWMGDHGWIEYLSTELRGLNVVGDTTRIHGRITDRLVREGSHLVELDMWSQNQIGEITSRGKARVRLPGREAGDAGAAPELAYRPGA